MPTSDLSQEILALLLARAAASNRRQRPAFIVGALLAARSCTFPKPFNLLTTMSATVPPLTRQRPLPIEFYLFVAVLALRLLSLARLAQSDLFLPGGGDMQFYNSWALRILHGSWTDHLAFYGLPLYPYLLAAIYKVCGYTPFVPGLLQAILDSGTAVLIYKLARSVFAESNSFAAATRISRGKVIGLLAAIGWMLCEPAQAYSIILMPTAWFVFVFWFIVWRIVTLTQAPCWWLIFSLGLLAGFTAMGVATILVLVPLLLVAVFVRWPASKARRLTSAALIIGGVLAGTSPAWIHNCFVARDPVFLSAHGGINFWIGNNPEATGYPRFPPGLHSGQQALLQDSIRVAEETSGHALRRSEVSSYWSNQAKRWIASHPFGWLELLGRKIENFWSAFQYDDLSIITELREQAIIFPGISFGAIAALALPGMLIACWRLRESRWIVAAVLLQMVSLLPVFVTERYRLAAVPGLLLCAGLALYYLWRWATEACYLRVLLFLLLLATSTAFVCLPQQDGGLSMLDAYNSGVHALQVGRLAEAKRKLDLAYACFPRSAEVNFAQGNLNLALGRSGLARNFYAATLQLDPKHERALNNLGVMALEGGDYAVAVQFLHRAVSQTPNNAKLHYLLAKTYAKLGDLWAARAEIRRAIELDGHRPEFFSLECQLGGQTGHG